MERIKPYLKVVIVLLFAAATLVGLARRTPEFLGTDNTTSVVQSPTRNDHTPPSDYNFQNNAPSPTRQTSFIAVGDIMLSRSVAAQMDKRKDLLIPFRNVDELLRSADFNFGNLESPFSNSDNYTFDNQLVFNAPSFAIEGLKRYFGILGTANNHAYDQGAAGISRTRKVLSQNGIKHTGIGNNLDEAWTGQVMESGGIRVGFLSASYTPANTGIKNDNVAVISDTVRMQHSIATLKQQSDFIVVAMHAGTEYTRQPNVAQINFAHAAIDAGADLIIGAHPHWIQPVELYRGKYILYSLGNFVFDQGWSQDTKEGLAAKITLTSSSEHNSIPKLKQIELTPVIIEGYCCPRPATSAEAVTILNKIGVKTPLLIPANSQ